MRTAQEIKEILGRRYISKILAQSKSLTQPVVFNALNDKSILPVKFDMVLAAAEKAITKEEEFKKKKKALAGEEQN